MQPATLLLAASALFASSSRAADTYVITEPAAGAIVSSKQPSVIAWTSTDTTNKVSVFLETATSKQHLYTIASDIYDSGSISWQPLANITPATDYVIALVADGSSTEFYSAAFTISSSSNSSNSFAPTAGQSIQAGSTTIIEWPLDSSVADVSIFLMEGASTSSLTNVSTVATGIKNLGTVAYIIPADTPSGSDYVFAIQDASDTSNTVYTPQFTIVGTSTASATGTAAGGGSATGTATGKATGTATRGSTATTTTSSPSSTSKSAASRDTASSAVVAVFAAVLAYLAI